MSDRGARSTSPLSRGSASSRSARRDRWLFAALIAFYGLVAVLMLDHVDDDAFIYFRTAANIAGGHGYVFNAGGERIETGSSLSWQYLLVLAYLLRLDLLLFSKIAGVVLGGAALYVVWCISRRVLESRRLQLLPSLLLCVTIPFYGWVQRGLETALYVFSVVLLAHFLTHERLRRFWYLPTLLVVLSRSEGIIVLAGLLGFVQFERKRLREHLGGAGIVLGTLAAVALFRFVYFHDFVPHAYYVKIQELPGLPLRAALLYFSATGTWVLLPVAFLGLLDRRAWSRDVITLAVLNLPLLWWGFRTCTLVEYHRYLVPALPLLYVISVRGLDRLMLKGRSVRHAIGWASGMLVLWLAFGAPALSLSINPTPNLLTAALTKASANPAAFGSRVVTILRRREAPVPPGQESPDGIASTWANSLGGFIRNTYPRGITIVFDQMGQTPWYAGLDKTFIDTLGLTYRPAGFAFYDAQITASDSAIQRAYRSLSERLLGIFWNLPPRRLTHAEVAEQIFALHPHLVILYGSVDPNGADLQARIARDPRLATEYVVRDWPFLKLHVRKDLPSR